MSLDLIMKDHDHLVIHQTILDNRSDVGEYCYRNYYSILLLQNYVYASYVQQGLKILQIRMNFLLWLMVKRKTTFCIKNKIVTFSLKTCLAKREVNESHYNV